MSRQKTLQLSENRSRSQVADADAHAVVRVAWSDTQWHDIGERSEHGVFVGPALIVAMEVLDCDCGRSEATMVNTALWVVPQASERTERCRVRGAECAARSTSGESSTWCGTRTVTSAQQCQV